MSVGVSTGVSTGGVRLVRVVVPGVPLRRLGEGVVAAWATVGVVWGPRVPLPEAPEKGAGLGLKMFPRIPPSARPPRARRGNAIRVGVRSDSSGRP